MNIQLGVMDLDCILQQGEALHDRVNEMNLVLGNLHRFNVILDPDPVSLGLASINAKISQIQQNKDSLCQIMFEGISVKNEAENLLTETEKLVASVKSTALENIPGIQEMKNQAMRDMAIEKHITEYSQALSQVTQLANACKNNFQKINFQIQNLESANQNLKKQIEVISFQININEITRKG